MTGNKAVTCVSVKGREGMWRILTGNYHSADKDDSKELNEVLFEQPESQGFFKQNFIQVLAWLITYIACICM